MTNINIISFFTGKILKKFPLLKETFVVVYFVDYPGFLIDYALIAISFALTTKYTMKRIAIFLSAASLAVTGMISCEKEPDTEAPVPVV